MKEFLLLFSHHVYRSCDGAALRLGSGMDEFDFQQTQELPLFSELSYFPSGPSSLVFNRDLGLLHPEVQRPRREDDQSPIAKVKNE